MSVPKRVRKRTEKDRARDKLRSRSPAARAWQREYRQSPRRKAWREAWEARNRKPRFCECGSLLSLHRRKCDRCKARDRERPSLLCRGCSAEFVPRGAQRYCSPECRNRTNRREAKHRRRARAGVTHPERLSFVAICERDGWRCHICRRKVDPKLTVPHPLAPTRDHLVPLAEGGSHSPTNVRLAHFICNSRRGARGGNEQLLLL